MAHAEHHYIHRAGWLRAAVLGANDGIVSTASVMFGVAAAGTDNHTVLLAGVASLVAGAMSMAAGEYVSVSSQADTERADLRRERQALESDPAEELEELTEIYRERGLAPALARQVAEQLMEHDDLGAHARDELGISPQLRAQPLLAALSSGASFCLGAWPPLLVSLFVSGPELRWWLVASAILLLMCIGVASAVLGGTRVLPSVLRVTLWGAAAMALTGAVGLMFGIAV
ncbi:MAG: VIT family protein [Pseudomonadota bacterium]